MKEEFNIFENADDEIISEISEQFQADEKEKERIFRISEEMYMNKRNSDKEEFTENTVSGVEHYKPVWYKSVAAAVTGILLVGAVAGAGWVMLDSNRNQNKCPSEEVLTEENTEEITTEEVTEEITEPPTEEPTMPFMELPVHENPVYAETMDEADTLQKEHSVEIEWNERHDYRVDTEYYAGLLLSDGYDINCSEAKNYIYHLMLNSSNYFSTAKGQLVFEYTYGDDKIVNVCDFEDDVDNQNYHSKSNNNSEYEYFAYDDCLTEVSHENKTYRKYHHNKQEKIFYVEDNFRHIELPSPDYGLTFPVSSMFNIPSYEKNLLMPECYAFKFLENFENWSITALTEKLGHTAVIIETEDTAITVDIKTGIMLEFTTTDERSELTSLEIDVPIERKEFDPTGLELENPMPDGFSKGWCDS